MISESLDYLNAAVSAMKLQMFVCGKRAEKWRTADRAASYKRGIVWRRRVGLNKIIGHTRWMEKK